MRAGAVCQLRCRLVSTEIADLFLTVNAILIIAVAVVAVTWVPAWLFRRARTRRAKVPAQLQRLMERQTTALHSGRLESAVAVSREIIGDSDFASLAPIDRLLVHNAFGRALARAGQDGEALAQYHLIRMAIAEDTDLAFPPVQAMNEANASLVLRRLGRLDEALEVAEQAAQYEVADVCHLAPTFRAGLAIAQLALALAQTDSGVDGRAAARKALEILQRLDDQNELSGEPVAYAYYVMAYAARPHGEDTTEWAREAVDRFTALHAATPGLYERRLADAVALAGSP
jgi:tetratricopeptide (TPR) repeat protein